MAQTLKLQQKIRALRDELHHAEAERDVYRELHARTVDELHQAVDRSPAEMKRLRAETETLQIRHRSYKLLVQHYMRAASRSIPPYSPNSAAACSSTSCSSAAGAFRSRRSRRRYRFPAALNAAAVRGLQPTLSPAPAAWQ